MLRIHSISLGCPKNRVDTERTLGSLGPIRLVDRPEDADCVFINTCGFIAPAVEESVRSIMDVLHRVQALDENAPRPGGKSRKASRPAGLERPLVVVAGCLVGRYGKKVLAPDLPEVDLLLDNRELERWPGHILAALARVKAEWGSKAAPAASALPPSSAVLPPAGRLLSTGPSYAWLKISEGCRHACSFCTIPAIRGKLRSTPAGMLREEARLLLEQGVKELVLVAQDVTAYGRDLRSARGGGPKDAANPGLRGLLEALLPLPGLARLRLMYLYPAGLTRDLLLFLKDAGSPFVPYFDIPLQHAAKGVLERMGRPFAGDPRRVVDNIRAVFPDAALRTSIITGFPGETEQDFATLADFVRETRFHHLGVFAYQAEEGTPAAAMEHQVPDREKQWRRDTIMDMQGEISEEILSSHVGQRLSVLVDAPHGEWPGLHVGRAWFQAPESDGITYISGPGVSPGALVDADIVESSVYDLTALTDAREDGE